MSFLPSLCSFILNPFLLCLIRDLLSLEQSGAATVVRTVKGSTNTCHVDQRTELEAATERTAKEAREEEEEAERKKAAAAKATHEEAAAAAKAQADATTKAQVDATAKTQMEEAAHGQAPQFVTPLDAAPPVPEISAPTGGAGRDHPVMEREGGMASPSGQRCLHRKTIEDQGGQPDAQPMPPAGGELAAGETITDRSPARKLVDPGGGGHQHWLARVDAWGRDGYSECGHG